MQKYSSTQLAELMIEDDFYIKDLTGKKGFESGEYIRIAVRDKDDNGALITKLKEL